jgi:hypothetical protein
MEVETEMSSAQQRLVSIARDALDQGKTVMIAIRGSSGAPIVAIELSDDGELIDRVSAACRTGASGEPAYTTGRGSRVRASARLSAAIARPVALALAHSLA